MELGRFENLEDVAFTIATSPKNDQVRIFEVINTNTNTNIEYERTNDRYQDLYTYIVIFIFGNIKVYCIYFIVLSHNFTKLTKKTSRGP